MVLYTRRFLYGEHMGVRLQKLLASCGITSRRKAEWLIANGRVLVNGEVVTELGARAFETDEIIVDGERMVPQEKVYIMLNKPSDIITSAKDNYGRKTVLDLVPKDVRLFPVGRLDYETSGLLFLTNDGDWANKLTHPSMKVEKTYVATVKGIPTRNELMAFRRGLLVDGKLTAPCSAELISPGTIKITLHEGRNRQVRKMCEAIGHPVVSLKRVSIGSFELGDLGPGQWRYLTDIEVLEAVLPRNI